MPVDALPWLRYFVVTIVLEYACSQSENVNGVIVFKLPWKSIAMRELLRFQVIPSS